MGIDPVDAGVIGLIAISGLFAFFRGLIREIFAIAGWAGASLITLWTFPYASPPLRQWTGHALVGDGVAIVGVFVVVLVVVSFISHALSTKVHATSMGALDRSLGFLFGVVRGAIIVCLAYLAVGVLASSSEDPAWLKGARTLPLVRGGAEMLSAIVPASLRDKGVQTAKEVEAKTNAAVEDANKLKELRDMMPVPATGGQNGATPGYTQSERQRLLQLYKNSQGQ